MKQLQHRVTLALSANAIISNDDGRQLQALILPVTFLSTWLPAWLWRGCSGAGQWWGALLTGFQRVDGWIETERRAWVEAGRLSWTATKLLIQKRGIYAT